MKSFIAIFVVALLATISLPFAAPAVADDTAEATAYVDDITNNALGILKSSDSKAVQTKKLEKLIKDHVDIKWIGQFVMGKHWRTASKAQQSDYLKHYEGFILSSYASRFTEYKGNGHKMISTRADGNQKFTVKMSIDVDGKPTYIDYKLKQKGGSFNVYDLSVEGVSLITTQRSEFNSIIQSKGVDYLISQLANKSGQQLATVN